MFDVPPTNESSVADISRHIKTPFVESRQSRVSMSAETGPVAHKPLSRVQVSHFLPGANAAFAFGDCPTFEADYAETQRRGPEYAEGIALRASRAERGWRMSGDIL